MSFIFKRISSIGKKSLSARSALGEVAEIHSAPCSTASIELQDSPEQYNSCHILNRIHGSWENIDQPDVGNVNHIYNARVGDYGRSDVGVQGVNQSDAIYEDCDQADAKVEDCDRSHSRFKFNCRLDSGSSVGETLLEPDILDETPSSTFVVSQCDLMITSSSDVASITSSSSSLFEGDVLIQLTRRYRFFT